MSILFSVRYVGQTGLGVAAMCLGGGTIVGFDGADGRYRGRYTEDANGIRGTITLTLPGPWPLVTGGQAVANVPLEMAFDWPPGFADGQPQQIYLGGEPVTVTLQKIGEIA
jgi:hypothetical protein